MLFQRQVDQFCDQIDVSQASCPPQSFRYMLILVKPGRVLISLMMINHIIHTDHKTHEQMDTIHPLG